jgi:hypothetical protein
MAGEAGFMEAMQGPRLLAALKIERKKLDYETSRRASIPPIPIAWCAYF